MPNKNGLFSRTRAFRKLLWGEFKNFPEQALHGHKAQLAEIMLDSSTHLALSLGPLCQWLYLRMWSCIMCVYKLPRWNSHFLGAWGRERKKEEEKKKSPLSLNILTDQIGEAMEQISLKTKKSLQKCMYERFLRNFSCHWPVKQSIEPKTSPVAKEKRMLVNN